MDRLRSRRTLAVVHAVLITLALLVFATPFASEEATAATTRCGTEIVFYSDASHTQVVGVWGWLPEKCNCQSYQWGTLSAYREYLDSYC